MSRKTLYSTVLLVLSLTTVPIAQQRARHSNDPKDVIVRDASIRFVHDAGIRSTQPTGHTLTGDAAQVSTTDCQTLYLECKAACEGEFGTVFTPALGDCLAGCLAQRDSCQAGQ